jgi:hypothetical protein
MIAPLALLLALQAPTALPRTDDVRAAVEDQLNALCSGEAEADACRANRATAEIRGLACRAAGEDAATCRYERRSTTVAGRTTQWAAAETNLRFDVETGLWFVDDAEAAED